MDSGQTTGQERDVAAASVAVDKTIAEQARRRAARWHAWLKSPECTFQDRKNFERWCADVTNAVAYVAFCGDLTAVPELADDGERSSHRRTPWPPFVHLPRLEAEQR